MPDVPATTAKCPIKNHTRCAGPMCMHCPKCERPWDDHYELGMDGKPAKCPKL